MVQIFTFRAVRQIPCHCFCGGEHKDNSGNITLYDVLTLRGLHFLAKGDTGLRIITSDSSGSLRCSYCLNCGFKIGLNYLPEDQWPSLSNIFIGDDFKFDNTKHRKEVQ